MTQAVTALPEKDYYPKVATWAEKQLGCFATRTDTGLRHGRIDVVGLRDTGGTLSGRSEVIAIEVKRGTQPFATCVGQASGYSIYADRCYLAEFKPAGFSDDEQSIAARLGVGLIQISGSVRVAIREIMTAPLREPLEGLRLQVVEKVGYSMCTICHSFFLRGDDGSWGANVVRQQRTRQRHIDTAFETDKGLVYWLDEQAERKPLGDGDTLHHRRYVCPDCVRALFPFITRVPRSSADHD